jgi:hypothetical protein
MQPNLEHVIALTNTKAARVEERCSYVVTGYVLTHPELAKKAVVDMAAVRWFPNVDEFMLMMTGRKLTPGPGTPPLGWSADELLSAAPAPAAMPTAPAAARPVLTAHPSVRLLESTEAALGVLAHELGCVYDVSIPHNAGWFVPGKPTACSSAYDAIRGLVESLKAGGTVYEGKSDSQQIDISASGPVAPKHNAPAPTIEQGALF